MLTRRSSLGIALTFSFPALKPAMAQSDRPLLVEMSFDRCPGCKTWDQNAGDAWRRSAQAQRMDFKLIEAATWERVSNPREWPKDCQQYQWVFEAFKANHQHWMRHDKELQGRDTTLNTAPRFILVQGQEIKAVEVGLKGWNAYMKAEIDKLVGV